CYIYLNLEKPEEKAIFETVGSFQEKLDAIYFLKGAYFISGRTCRISGSQAMLVQRVFNSYR
ncbi:MAG: hypothetical protein Q7W54_17280, partial [Bacteroidota bacterium]|nr:hypothetical protein [Bacteroidota bacterium]